MQVYPAVPTYVPLSPLLEFGGNGTGLTMPLPVVRDPNLRQDFLQITSLTRAVNTAVLNREELKRRAAFSGLMFDGSRPRDPRPGDAERLALDRNLLTRERRLNELMLRFLSVAAPESVRTEPAPIDTVDSGP